MACKKCGGQTSLSVDALCDVCTDEFNLCQGCGEEKREFGLYLGRNCLKKDVGACPKCDGPLSGDKTCLDSCGG